MDVLEERGRLAVFNDSDPNNIAFDVREDEEQNVKLGETMELLVAAGYFRARIKGLPAFDKVVGGLVWCISLCSVDLDVNLFYRENSTIGQKIALTEKIVRVLPRLNCPHAIEPHQIQGLDFIHIFPVVQWLVKRGIEAKGESEEFMKAYAASKFDTAKKLPQEKDENEKIKKAESAQAQLKDVSQPKRIFKRVGGNLREEEEESRRTASTLLEYGWLGRVGRTSEDQKLSPRDSQDEMSAMMTELGVVASGKAKVSSQALASLAADNQHVHRVALDSSKKSAVVGLGSPVEEVPQAKEDTLIALTRERDLLRDGISGLAEEEAKLDEDVKTMNGCLNKKQDEDAEAHLLVQRIEEMESEVDKEVLDQLKLLMDQRDETKHKEQMFKEGCKKELEDLDAGIASLKADADCSAEDSSEKRVQLEAELEKRKKKLEGARLSLAEVNREVARLRRALDETPSQQELHQYQRRFIELYNQVASKHKETKQFYTLYNTLTDVKMYMEKETALLDSVCSSYHLAATSEECKQQFLQQLEQILDGVKQNKTRVEKRESEEKLKLEQLRETQQEMLDKQRLYYKTVKDFQQECKRNEELLVRIRDAEGVEA